MYTPTFTVIVTINSNNQSHNSGRYNSQQTTGDPSYSQMWLHEHDVLWRSSFSRHHQWYSTYPFRYQPPSSSASVWRHIHQWVFYTRIVAPPVSCIHHLAQSTSDHNPCSLPYRLSTHAKTMLYDMWFCYQNECPTDLNQRSTCTSGRKSMIASFICVFRLLQGTMAWYLSVLLSRAKRSSLQWADQWQRMNLQENSVYATTSTWVCTRGWIGVKK